MNTETVITPDTVPLGMYERLVEIYVTPKTRDMIRNKKGALTYDEFLKKHFARCHV